MDQIFQSASYSSYIEQSEFIENQLLSQLGNNATTAPGFESHASDAPLGDADIFTTDSDERHLKSLSNNLPENETVNSSVLSKSKQEDDENGLPKSNADEINVSTRPEEVCINNSPQQVDGNDFPLNSSVSPSEQHNLPPSISDEIRATHLLEVKSPDQINTELCQSEKQPNTSEEILQSNTNENRSDKEPDVDAEKSERILLHGGPHQELNKNVENEMITNLKESNEIAEPNDSADDIDFSAAIPNSDLDNHSDQSEDSYDAASHDDQSENNTIIDKPKRKRRRIRMLNDSESDDSRSNADYDERARILEPSVTDNDEDFLQEEAINEIVINERPGPKSSKASTRIQKELEVRALLRNAIVIPVPGGSDKKRTNRILDSDEEIEIDDSVGMNAEGIGIDCDAVISDDAIIENDNMDQSTNEGSVIVAQLEPMCILECADEENQQIEDANFITKNLLHTVLDVSTVRDSGNSTDSAYHQASSASKRASNLANNVELMQTQRSSFTDDEFVPNHVYFGSTDNYASNSLARPGTSARGRGKRGRPSRYPAPKSNGRIDRQSSESSSSESDEEASSSDEKSWKPQTGQRKIAVNNVKSQYQRVSNSTQPPAKVPNRKKDRFYDKSREIPNDVYFGDVTVPLHVLHSYGKQGSSDDEPSKLPFARPVAKRAIIKEIPKLPMRGPIRGRGRGRVANTLNFVPKIPAIIAPKKKKPLLQSGGGGDTLISEMKDLLKAAGLKHDKFKHRWEGLPSRQDRANKMLELLYENGLEGEATIANCRQLRKLILAKKEIEDLDPTLIIATEGRATRRSVREAKKLNYQVEDEEADGDNDNTHDTLVRLRNVIDSDSDSD